MGIVKTQLRVGIRQRPLYNCIKSVTFARRANGSRDRYKNERGRRRRGIQQQHLARSPPCQILRLIQFLLQDNFYSCQGKFYACGILFSFSLRNTVTCFWCIHWRNLRLCLLLNALIFMNNVNMPRKQERSLLFMHFFLIYIFVCR